MDQLAALKKFIEDDYVLTETCPLSRWTDDQLQKLIDAIQPFPAEEDMAFYRLAAARTERLQRENEELQKRLLEARMPPGMPSKFVP
jgi:hypothetical protein